MRTLLLQLLLIGTITEIFVASAAPSENEKSWADCYIHTQLTTEIQKTWDEAYKKCEPILSNFKGGKSGIPFPDIKTPLKDFDVDDKCYSECLYKGIGAVADDKMKKNIAEVIFASNSTGEIMSKTSKAWDKCIDDSETEMKSKSSANKCMVYAMHMFCFQQKIVDEKIYDKC